MTKEPCAFTNPALWRAFCAATERDIAPSYNWTEQDVRFWFDENDKSQAEIKDFQTISQDETSSFSPPDTPKQDKVSRHNDELRAEFATRLYNLDFTVREAAISLGVTERTISRWLNGHAPVPRMAVMSLELLELRG